MGLLAKIFGTDEVIKKATDGIYDGIDAAWFTPEEKSKHFLKLLKLYEPYKLIQRILALLVGIPYIATYIVSTVMYLVGAFSEADIILDTAKKLASMNNDTLGQPFSIMLAFYFGGGMLEGAIRARNEKK